MNLTKEEPTNQIILGFYLQFSTKNVFAMGILTTNNLKKYKINNQVRYEMPIYNTK